jgi:hypothetical protein
MEDNVLSSVSQCDRRSKKLRELIQEMETTAVDERFQGILAACGFGAFSLLANLPTEVAEGTTPSNQQSELFEAMTKLATDDDVFWTAFDLAMWGFLAVFTAAMWPARYFELAEIAEQALGAPSPSEWEIYMYGPFTNLDACLPYLSEEWTGTYLTHDEIDGDVRFHAIIVDLLLEEMDLDDQDEIFSELTDANGYWLSAWNLGAEDFREILAQKWPDWQEEMEGE